MPDSDSTYLLLENAISPIDSPEQNVDSIKEIAQTAVERFDGILYPSLPQTESWVFGVLFGLFFLLVLAIRLYPSLIYEDIRSIFRVKERSSIFSNLEGSDSRLRVLYIIFSFCTISLYAYFIMFTKYESEYDGFSFIQYLYFLIVTCAYFLIKSFFIRLLNFVFFDRKTLKISVRSYYSIITFFGLSLFPLLILNIYTSSSIVQIVSIGICILTATLIILKLFQIFYTKPLDSFYILLYLCTLEILPILALFQAYKMIV